MNRHRMCLVSIGSALLLVAAGVAAQAPANPLEKKADPAELAFQKLDRDGNKLLTLQEFKPLYVELMQQARLRRLQSQFQSRDSNRDGNLDATEFAELLLVKSLGSKAPAFAAVDTDNNARVDFREYVVMIGKFVESAPAAGKRP